SSHVDRFMFTDDSEHLNVKLLIKNLKNAIMKKLLMSCMTGSSASLSASSVISLKSSTLVPASDSPAPAIPALTTLTPATSASATSAFSASVTSAVVISSPCFKKILYRLDKSHFS
ncbi:hypothetical protein BDBG_16756, partial [Blastomyces gilchristii SLH14081]